MVRFFTILFVGGVFAGLVGLATQSAQAGEKPAKKPRAEKAGPAKPAADKDAPGKAAADKHAKKHDKKEAKRQGPKRPDGKVAKYRPGWPLFGGFGRAGHRGAGPGFQPWGRRGAMAGPFGFGRGGFGFFGRGPFGYERPVGPFGRFGPLRQQGPGYFGRGPWGPGRGFGFRGGRGGFRIPPADKPPVKLPGVEELFKSLDTNQDGSISKEEFGAGMKKVREGMRQGPGPMGGPRPGFGPPGMRPPFAPRGESPGIRPPFGPQAGAFGGRPGFGPPGGARFGAGFGKAPDASALFDRFDKNKDGKLTKDEAPAPMWDRLSKADTNKDGAISKEEFEGARKQMMEQFQERSRSKGPKAK